MGGGISHTNNNKNLNEITQRFQANYILGRGASSCVYHATDKITDRVVALKRVNFNTTPSSLSLLPLDLEHAAKVSLDELNTFKRIGSRPFIVSLHCAYRYKSSCYLAMDYLGGGDLRRLLKREDTLNEESVTYIVGCIGSALHHLHSLGVIHRDLKPENIAFDLVGRPYLTDFGISSVSTDDNPIPICSSSSGTLAYLAPEVLTPSNRHSHQSDFWSLGVIAYELLCHQRPFQKHCPVSFIQFSAREYSTMWTELLTQATASPFVDFDQIYQQTIQQELKQQQQQQAEENHLVKPKLFSTLNIHFNEDGSVPRSLVVPTPGGISVSNEFRSLLNGLLDIRIPQRLGNIMKFSSFSEHPIFMKHGYVFSQLHRITSPLRSTMVPITVTPSSMIDPITFDEIESVLPTSINNKLAEFHFMRPEMESKILFRKRTKSESIETTTIGSTSPTSPGSRYY